MANKDEREDPRRMLLTEVLIFPSEKAYVDQTGQGALATFFRNKKTLDFDRIEGKVVEVLGQNKGTFPAGTFCALDDALRPIGFERVDGEFREWQQSIVVFIEDEKVLLFSREKATESVEF